MVQSNLSVYTYSLKLYTHNTFYVLKVLINTMHVKRV